MIYYFSQVSNYIFRSFNQYMYGNTSLHYSILYDSDDLQKLASNKELIDLKNYKGRTALMLASKLCNMQHVKLLVENNASVSLTDNTGKTALLHASKSADSTEIAEYLIQYGADPLVLDQNHNSGIHFSAKTGNLNMLKLFRKHGLPIDQFNYKKKTPLMIAALSCRFDVASFLTQNGADMLKRYCPKSNTVFEHALMGKCDKIIDLFISKN